MHAKVLKFNNQGNVNHMKNKMLVANPGQTPYSLISKKPCHTKPARNNAFVGSSVKCTPPSSAVIKPSTSAVAANMMTAVTAVPSCNEANTLKTLSVRISRETDLLKHTVQKALISKIPSHFSSVLSLNTVPPTSTHRFPERTESLSVDSLRTEMCHFKPIRTVPTTPSKKSKAVIIKTPKATKAVREEQSCDETNKSSSISTPVVLASARISAFCTVALADKTPTFIDKNQQHKKKSKSAQQKEETIVLERTCRQPRVLVKHIGTVASHTKKKQELNPPISSKPRTRRLTKTADMSVADQHKSPTLTDDKMRVTRKRQATVKNDESFSTKHLKLIKDCSKTPKSGKKSTATAKGRKPSRRTPPVTRSRLKQSMILTRKQYRNK